MQAKDLAMTKSRPAPERGHSPTLQRWIEAGALPVHRLGKQIRISQPDLAAFIARSRSICG